MIKLPPKKSIEFEIDGETFSLRKPGLLELDDVVKSYSSNEPDLVQKIVKWFIGLGMPAHIASQLDQEQFEEIIAHVSGQKKS